MSSWVLLQNISHPHCPHSPFGQIHSVGQQHGHNHGSYPTRSRCDPGSNLSGRIKVHITHWPRAACVQGTVLALITPVQCALQCTKMVCWSPSPPCWVASLFRPKNNQLTISKRHSYVHKHPKASQHSRFYSRINWSEVLSTEHYFVKGEQLFKRSIFAILHVCAVIFLTWTSIMQ